MKHLRYLLIVYFFYEANLVDVYLNDLHNPTLMKKITLALTAIICYGAITAQPTRLVLFEEFTQASCGPCASQNPAFNALLAANSAKAISIKYQTSWPGVDPMNAANPVDAQARVTYYSVSGVPWSAMDGSATTGGSYSGAPANATAAVVPHSLTAGLLAPHRLLSSMWPCQPTSQT